MKIIDGNKLKH